jgi:hypothetical protein
MSVKKSLWIGIALAAVALLFGACSTEDSDSDGGSSFSYQKTALWEAASAARTNLVATKVSDQAGNDIGTSDKWVSPVQYNAFNKDITDAEAAAEALGRSALAIEPTPAEQEHLDKLLANQAKFDSYKASGLATETTTANFATDLAAGTTIVKQDITVSSGTPEVATTKILTIEDATLNVGAVTSFTITGGVGVKEGGVLVLNDTIASLAGTGSITLYSGSKLNDAEGFTTGSTIVHTGAVLTNALGSPFIGPDKGDSKGKIFQLTAGKLTKAISAASYTIDGDAALVGTFTAGASALVVLESTSTLTIANGGKLSTTADAAFLTGITGAKIVIADGGSITAAVASMVSTGPANIPTLAGLWKVTDAGEPTSVGTIAGPVTLIYNGTAWVKQ